MVLLKQKIPVYPQSAIASFPYQDIADLTGISVFDGFAQTIEATETLESVTRVKAGLTTNGDFWAKTETSKTLTTSSSDNPNISFDLSEFQLPRTIKGTGKICVSWRMNNSSGSWNAGGGAYMKLRLAKVTKDTTGNTLTETDITESSGARKQSGIATEFYNFEIPQTDFKKGETLRVIAAVHSDGIASDGLIGTIAHDPKDRDGTQIVPSMDASETTRFICHLPFRIEIQ